MTHQQARNRRVDRVQRALTSDRLTFVPDHRHVRHSACGERGHDEAIPVVQVLKAVVVCDVVTHHHRLFPVDGMHPQPITLQYVLDMSRQMT